MEENPTEWTLYETLPYYAVHDFLVQDTSFSGFQKKEFVLYANGKKKISKFTETTKSLNPRLYSNLYFPFDLESNEGDVKLAREEFVHIKSSAKLKIIYQGFHAFIYIKDYNNKDFKDYLKTTSITKPKGLKYSFNIYNIIKQHYHLSPMKILSKINDLKNNKIINDSITLEEIRNLIKNWRMNEKSDDQTIILQLLNTGEILNYWEDSNNFVYVFKNVKNFQKITNYLKEFQEIYESVPIGWDGLYIKFVEITHLFPCRDF